MAVDDAGIVSGRQVSELLRPGEEQYAPKKDRQDRLQDNFAAGTV
jgi:hypothetical protein